jgi:hypothetical protein
MNYKLLWWDMYVTKMEDNKHIWERNQNLMTISNRKYIFNIGRCFLIKGVFFGITWRIQRAYHAWKHWWSWILGMMFRTVSNYSWTSGAFWKRSPRGWEFIILRNYKLQGAKGVSKEDASPQQILSDKSSSVGLWAAETHALWKSATYSSSP